MERRRIQLPASSDYFPEAAQKVPCIPSGCTVLDCVLGGGWALGRIANIVGDKSTGKTLLAIEACASFAKHYPKGRIWYRESEAAFDDHYAAKLGLPVKQVDFGPNGLGTPWDTIEDIFEDLDAQLTKSKTPGLYVIDSLDALSSRAELKRKIDEGSYGMEKQKRLGELFRRLARRAKAGNVSIIFISQVRDKIGVMFGEKHSRSGGKSLDFYASQILWLSHIGRIYGGTKIGNSKRAIGVDVKAQCKKNKITTPFGECMFSIRFGYGILDIEASLDWLAEAKMLGKLNLKESEVDAFLKDLNKATDEQYKDIGLAVKEAVVAAWKEVEARDEPVRRKYS